MSFLHAVSLDEQKKKMSKQCQKLKTFLNNATKSYVVCWPLQGPVPFFLLAYRSLAKIHLEYICFVKAKRMHEAQTTESVVYLVENPEFKRGRVYVRSVE